MTTEKNLSCRYRGKIVKPGFFKCEIHGICSLEKEHSRIRPCITCEDRREGISPEDPHKYLGDRVESALRIAGITKDRVTNWLGFDCRCEETQEKLNQLDKWARRVVSGKVEMAKEFLEKIME